MVKVLRCTVWLLVFCSFRAANAYADGSVSAADGAGAEPAGYRETVEEAVLEFGAHHYEESRSLFARAHALYPNARTHRGMGLTEFELRNYDECIKQLEAALKSTVKPLSAELRADTERVLARANNFVARVVVDAKPSSSKILVDGRPVGVPSDQALLLQMGEHTLDVQAPGYLSEHRELSIRGGEQKTLTIRLAKSRGQAATPEQKPGADRPRGWYKSPWVWVGLGVVLAGVATGAGFALSRDSASQPYGGSRNTALYGP